MKGLEESINKIKSFQLINSTWRKLPVKKLRKWFPHILYHLSFDFEKNNVNDLKIPYSTYP